MDKEWTDFLDIRKTFLAQSVLGNCFITRFRISFKNKIGFDSVEDSVLISG